VHPLVLLALLAVPVAGSGEPVRFDAAADPGGVVLAREGAGAPILVDAGDHPGVRRAAGDLAADVERVTGVRPAVGDVPREAAQVVIVGSLGRGGRVDRLAASGRLDVAPIRGRWEAWLLQVVDDPEPGIARALVIAGSDPRGAIYGVYEVSERIGVSPWYGWADVPTRRQPALVAHPGRSVDDGPAVRYRGLFLNDEEPALGGWVRERFGGFDHRFYERVFELILRLRGNYLWPAMWNSAFFEDDPENARLADLYGVVMGTTHHEPMLRDHQEWRRHGRGAWNYETNAEELRDFWAEGIARSLGRETIVSVGMRGDGDRPMSEQADVALLERIVADQRRIIREQTGRPPEETPQLWALYKEVQGYYERGMRVPDDVTLLWSDDNWGNLRRLPTAEERGRAGGAGVYYHLDYVGGPRSYKWIDTVPLQKIQERMHRAWRYGADRIWIVNVGDLKPMERPAEFFLRMAWEPERWTHERTAEFQRVWAEREFGAGHAAEIAALVDGYDRFAGRRKPELLEPDTYSLVSYGEAERIEGEIRGLRERAERVGEALPAEAQDAYFQLVLYPIRAMDVVTELYAAVGRNRLGAVQGRSSTNGLAERARALFREDAELTRTWDAMGGGRWRHMMDQTHLGYTYWQQPVADALPAVTELQLPEASRLGVAVEGQAEAWPTDSGRPAPALPPLDVFADPERRVEVFNRGQAPFPFTAVASEPWLQVEPAAGEVETEVTLAVRVDWERAPAGHHTASVTIEGAGESVSVAVPVFRPAPAEREAVAGFVESDGHVAIEAPHFDRAVSAGAPGGDGVHWETIEGYGPTLGGVAAFPVTAASPLPAADSARLEYGIHFFTAGEAKLELQLAPSLSFVPGRGLRLGVSLDDEEPRVVEVSAEETPSVWARSVIDSVRRVQVPLQIPAPGHHRLTLWFVDPGVVLHRLVVDTGGLRPSSLGPPESPHVPPLGR